MKINRATSADPLLPPDFAPRIVQQVARIKRRRIVRRRGLAVAGVLAITLVAFLAQRRETAPLLQTAIALQSPRGNGSAADTISEPVSNQEQAQPSMNLFLPDTPDTYLMTNFQESTGEPSWHSYDSWWSSNS